MSTNVGGGEIRVLVTGAAGYVGSLATEALSRDARVAAVVAFDVRAGAERPGVTWVVGDITRTDLEALLREQRINRVVHLASILEPPRGAPADFAYRVDVEGTERLLRACVATGVTQLVVTTSGAAYGYHADNPAWLDEDAPLRGNDSFEYSRNKRLIEELLARFRAEHPGLGQLVLRPGTVLGAGTRSAVTSLFEGPFVLGIWGSESPFVFIWDLDLVRLIVRGVTEPVRGVFNCAGDGALTGREIARRLDKPFVSLPAWVLATALWVGKRLRLTRHGPEGVAFIRYRPVLANGRLKRELAFDPRPSAGVFATWVEGRRAAHG